VAARLVDWALAALVAALIATGILTLFAGSPGDAWVYVAHDALGVAIAVLLVFKLRRVWARIASLERWDGRTLAGAFAAVLAVAALASGFLWSDGANASPGGYSLLSWHDALGAALVVIVGAHMVARAKRLRGRDLTGRRQFFAVAGIAAGSFVAWRAQRPLLALLGLPGARRRFTGSYEADSFAGNAFPTTSWVADHPRPIDAGSYRLRVSGLAERPLALPLSELPGADELVATLDCTGGFYSTQRWRGVLLGRVLDRAAIQGSATHISVGSVTGYRWSFALSDARELLLATHVGGQPLSHLHGAPVRLVVPGARGFQWIKWVDHVELLDHPDYGAPASTIVSSFSAPGSGGS
jgi:DMSO/TMAO reductase YedYZ molybdopterin-dependent catalytic subunit